MMRDRRRHVEDRARRRQDRRDAALRRMIRQSGTSLTARGKARP